MKVYIVCRYDYEYTTILGTFSSQENAEMFIKATSQHKDNFYIKETEVDYKIDKLIAGKRLFVVFSYQFNISHTYIEDGVSLHTTFIFFPKEKIRLRHCVWAKTEEEAIEATEALRLKLIDSWGNEERLRECLESDQQTDTQ